MKMTEKCGIDWYVAGHYFISLEFVWLLNLKAETTQPYCVKLGDRHWKQTNGFCRDVEVQMEECTFKETFFLFELGGVDLILGVTWLDTLGDVKSESEKFIHEFWQTRSIC